MPIDNLEEMIVRQLSNNLTEKEADELLNWYNSSEDNKKLYNDYCVLLKAQSIALDRRLFEKDNMRSWKRLRRRIQQKRVSGFWLPVLRYASVAVVALLVGMGIHMLLSDADTATGGMQVTVPAGSKSKIVLPDGTSVWLNSGSKLTYTGDFGKINRVIYLDGEGFFDVTKNKEIPFEVYAGEARIRVLGTQFNVKAYGGEEAVATLVHGKVEVARGQEAVVLQPGEQCRIAAGEAHALIVGKADLMSTLAWKNGEFVFKDASLEQVIDELARWYNVEMMYDHSLFRESRVHIYMNRSQTLDEALDMLSKAWNIRYERQGTKVWLGERHTGGTDSD